MRIEKARASKPTIRAAMALALTTAFAFAMILTATAAFAAEIDDLVTEAIVDTATTSAQGMATASEADTQDDTAPIMTAAGESNAQDGTGTATQDDDGAASEAWLDDYDYDKDPTAKTITLTKYKGTNTDVTVYGKTRIGSDVYTTILQNTYDEDSYFAANAFSNADFDSPVWPPEFTSFTFVGGVKLFDARMLFDSFGSLAKVDAEGLDVSECTDMSGMFFGCYSLTELKAPNWETGNVTTAKDMFGCCDSLETIDAPGWNVNNLTVVREMFRDLFPLKTLNAPNWNVSSLTSMDEFFSDLNLLETLNAPNWNASSAKTMQDMFSGCYSLTKLDVSGWQTSSLENMARMLDYVPFGTAVDLSSWDLSKITAYPETGELKVSKTIAEGSDASSSQEFTFKIALSYVNEEPLLQDEPIEGPFMRFATMAHNGGKPVAATIQDGVITLFLKGAGYAVIGSLPDGVMYTIVENAATGWNLVSKAGETEGAIDGKKASEATFTNGATAIPATEEKAPDDSYEKQDKEQHADDKTDEQTDDKSDDKTDEKSDEKKDDKTDDKTDEKKDEKADDKAEDKSDKGDSKDTTATSQKGGKGTQTGDNLPVLPFAGLALASLAVLVVARRKQQGR